MPQKEWFSVVEAVAGDECWIGNDYGMAHFKEGEWDFLQAEEHDSVLRQATSISMVNKDKGWAAGGVIARYQNGRWHEEPRAPNEGINSIEMVSEELGWAVGGNGGVYKYDGENWNLYRKYEDILLESVSAPGLGCVYVAGCPFSSPGENYLNNRVFEITDTNG